MKIIISILATIFSSQTFAAGFTCEFTGQRKNPGDTPVELIVEVQNSMISRITGRWNEPAYPRVGDFDYFGPPHVNGVTPEVFEYNMGGIPAGDCTFTANQATVSLGQLSSMNFNATCNRSLTTWNLQMINFQISYAGVSGAAKVQTQAKDGSFPAFWQDNLSINNCQPRP